MKIKNRQNITSKLCIWPALPGNHDTLVGKNCCLNHQKCPHTTQTSSEWMPSKGPQREWKEGKGRFAQKENNKKRRIHLHLWPTLIAHNCLRPPNRSANGPFLVPMSIDGGSRQKTHMTGGTNLDTSWGFRDVVCLCLDFFTHNEATQLTRLSLRYLGKDSRRWMNRRSNEK